MIDLLDDPLARLGTPLQRIQYRHSIVLYYMTTHRFTATPTQVEMAQQNIFAARELQSPFQQAELLSSLGFVALLAGNFSESQRAYTEAVAIAEEHNFLNILERCYAYLAISYRREKNPALVADMVEKLSSISAKTTLHAYLPMISAQQAWLAYGLVKCRWPKIYQCRLFKPGAKNLLLIRCNGLGGWFYWRYVLGMGILPRQRNTPRRCSIPINNS